MKISNKTLSAFSIIEVMVWIFIFTLWLVSVYALLVSSLKINDFNRNSIIASNLAREQVELLRNVRDTNYKKLQVWNQKFPEQVYDPAQVFSGALTASWTYYILSHSLDITNPIQFEEISSFSEWETELVGNMKQYQLCQHTVSWEYLDCQTTTNPNLEETYFYRYLQIEDALDAWGNIINDTFKVRSKVIWFKRWYYEFEVETLLADWRRI